jgi:hypothetical protein
VLGPQTEPNICGSSGNRRKFYLCRGEFRKYPDVIQLFQTKKEYIEKQEEPNALAMVSDLVRGPAEAFIPATKGRLSHLPTVSSKQPEAIRDQKHRDTPSSKALLFFSKNNPPLNKTNVNFKMDLPGQASDGGGVGEVGGAQLSTLLRICREFCAAEVLACQDVHKVHFYCPFQEFIPLNC